MAVENNVLAGLAAIARATGGSVDPKTALKAAGMAGAASRMAGNLVETARTALRDLDAKDERPAAEPPAPPQDPIEEMATQAQAKPEEGGFHALLAGGQALVAGLREGYRNQRTAAGHDPDSPDDPLKKASQAVRKSLPVVIGKAGELVDKATPGGMDKISVTTRIAMSRASGADVAYAISHVDTWKGLFAGTSKLAYLGFLLKRMPKADPDVFEALDAFSNHNAERNKALVRICDAINDMRVDAETAIKTLRGFQLTNGKPDYPERKTALKTLVVNIERCDAPRVVEGFSDDEKQRLIALGVLAEVVNSVAAAEIAELLKVFGPAIRGKARKIIEPKLADPENVQLIDDLFAPKKGPDLKAVADAFGDLWKGLRKGQG